MAVVLGEIIFGRLTLPKWLWDVGRPGRPFHVHELQVADQYAACGPLLRGDLRCEAITTHPMI